MANPYPANILRADETIDREGYVDFTDPDNQPGGVGVPLGWTADDSNPANVTSNGAADGSTGTLEIGASPGKSIQLGANILAVTNADNTACFAVTPGSDEATAGFAVFGAGGGQQPAITPVVTTTPALTSYGFTQAQAEAIIANLNTITALLVTFGFVAS
jgi:hypothetical protein